MRQFLRIIFGLNVVFLVMLALAYPGVEPGTESYVVMLLSLGVISVTLLASGVLLYVDWDPREREDWRDHLEADESVESDESVREKPPDRGPEND